ncbi:MAG: hypothetical protein WC740_01935 [Verrucomicrobiia bacterium]
MAGEPFTDHPEDIAVPTVTAFVGLELNTSALRLKRLAGFFRHLDRDEVLWRMQLERNDAVECFLPCFIDHVHAQTKVTANFSDLMR